MAGRPLVRIVDGYIFPEPSSYNANTSTLVDSSRNAQGTMVGSVIRDDVAKIEISWRYLTVQQWSDIQKCFKQSSGGKFINLIEFFDQSAGGWIQREMYVSDRKASVFRRDPNTGDLLGWVEPSLSLIEV